MIICKGQLAIIGINQKQNEKTRRLNWMWTMWPFAFFHSFKSSYWQHLCISIFIEAVRVLCKMLSCDTTFGGAKRASHTQSMRIISWFVCLLYTFRTINVVAFFLALLLLFLSLPMLLLLLLRLWWWLLFLNILTCLKRVNGMAHSLIASRQPQSRSFVHSMWK